MAEIIKMCCYTKSESLSELADKIINNLSSEIVCNERKMNDSVILLCFETYYFRCSSYVGLSILLTEETSAYSALIVGFSGGSGLLNISMGANKSIARKASAALKECGFIMQE